MGKPAAGAKPSAGAPLQHRDLNVGQGRDAKLKQQAGRVVKRSGGATPAAAAHKQLATPKTVPAASSRPAPATQLKTHQRRKSSSALAAARSPTGVKHRRPVSTPSAGLQRSPRTPRSKPGAASSDKAGKAAAPLAAVQSPSTGRHRSGPLAGTANQFECKPDEEELQYWREVDQEELVEEAGHSSSSSEHDGDCGAGDQDGGSVSIGSGGL